MQRRLWSILLCGAGLSGFAGCASFTETSHARVISSFIESLEKSDMEELKQVSSTDFQSSTLRHKEAADAFKVLNLPTGDVEVLDVKEEGPDERRVLVSVGEKNKKRKLYCDLKRDPQTKQWVVDDVEFKRQLKPGQVNKTVTEQMDLLLSIEEFVDAWESGKRQAILASSTPELREVLERLPESGLAKFTSKVTADLNRDKLKPEVEGHANMAVVRLPRKTGEIMLTLRQTDSRWLADDLAVLSRKEGESISSVRKQAEVMNTAIVFCEAYRAGNKPDLSKMCVPRFYRLNLENADLQQVPLPDIDSIQGDIDIKLLISRAEVLLKQNDQIIQLSLTQGPPAIDSEGRTIEAVENSHKPFLVEEVTLHELKSKQNKRLSALFSSQSIVQSFAQALAQRDLKAMRLSATADFNTRVWKRVELDQLGDLLLDSIESAPPQVVDTRFQGALTEVTVNQGQTPLTYVLRDQNGALMVDDVLTPALDRPNSLKMTLEVIIPLNTFTDALQSREIDAVRANVSREFNKLVFQSMNRIPKLKVDPTPFLHAPVNRIQLTTDRALLILGDDRFGAKVFLNKEDERYVVDDVMMISGIEHGQRTGLKQAMRQLVVGGTQIGSTHHREASNAAGGEMEMDAPKVNRSSRAPRQDAMLDQ